jgi:tetratricopeptide (TPR) repeat protein
MLTGEQAEDVALLPAIAGIGGIGKTRLAIEFVHRYRDRFPDGVFWLSMEQPETIETQVAACGGLRGLQLFDDELGEQLRRQTIGFDGELSRFERPRRLSLRERVEQVRAIWEGPGRRLIIFDNLEDPTLLEQWRPRGGGSRLLITTRRQSWKTGSGVRLLPLTSLTDEASLSLLLGPRAIERDRSIADLLADQGEAEAAQDIVRELGGLPLALTLAGRYLAECSMTLARYLEQLRTESINHHSLNAELVEGLPSGQRASIVASFALSYQRLGNDPTDHLARTIWLSAAQLAPEPILDEVLIRAAELEPTDDTQRERGEQALRRLRELGLIEYSDGSHRLHRLLRAYARIVTDDPLADWRRAVRGLGQTVQQLDEKLELSARPFLEHIRQLLDVRVANRDRDQADLLHAAGLIMYQDDDYPTARQYLQEALAIKEAVLGRRHRSTAVTLQVLGDVAYAEGDYPTARQYLQEALAIKEAVLGRRHRETAVILHGLGSVASAEGDYPTARQYWQEALAIKEAVLGRRHRSTAVTLHGLGSVAYAEGDYPTARQYWQEALAIKEAVLGRRHRETALTLHGLGSVASAEGDYPTARQYLQEALAIKEAVLGRRHRETAVTLHQLGWVALEEGDYPTARQYLQEALAIEEAVLGRRHRLTAVTLHELSKVAYVEGDYPTARQYLQEALEITEAVLGRRHRETAHTLHGLGSVAYAEGDYPKARQYLQEALAIKEAVLGRRHRSTAVTLHVLGWVALEEGDYPTARQYFQEALAIEEAVLGRRHLETMVTLIAYYSLFWRALFAAGMCALLSWFLLPAQVDLFAVGVVLLLGAIGYFWLPAATRLVRAVWRFQVGWFGMTLLLHLLGYVNIVISPTTLYALAACGGAVGLLFWPRLSSWQVGRAIRHHLQRHLQRQLYLTRQQSLRRQRRSGAADRS